MPSSPSPIKAVLGDSTWDLATAGEYTYDSDKIEFSGGVAQLKAAGIPGTDWITTDGSGNNWGNRKSITIDNTGGALKTDYQLNLANGLGEVYTNAKSDGTDIRFTDDDKLTELKFYKQSFNAGAQTSQFYVTIPTIAAASTKTVYIYYGNASASAPTNNTSPPSEVSSSNLKMWLKADALTANDGDAITTWTDSSGKGNSPTQATVSKKAIYKTNILNGKPVLRFNGTSNYYSVTLDSTLAMNSYSLMAVHTPTSVTSYGMLMATSSPYDHELLDINYPTNGKIATYHQGPGTVGGVYSFSSGTTYLNSFTSTTGTGTPYVNGTALSSGTPATTSAQSWQIGAYQSTGGYLYTGDIPEIILYSSTLSVTDRQKLEIYLANKYGLTITVSTIVTPSSYGSQVALYPTDNPILVPNTGQGYSTVSAFAETLGVGSTGNLKYQVSPDDGATWYWYTAGAWTTTVAGYTEANTASDINTQFAAGSFNAVGAAPKTLKWRAYFNSNGSQQPKLDNLVVTYVWDTADPDNPAALATAKSQAAGGTDITTDTWYNYPAPYFTWAEPSDNANPGETISGIAGYYVYFGTTATADPHASGIYQTGLTYTASSLVSGSTYYLRLETKDNAGNIHDIAAEDPSLFIYKYDSAAPTSPTYVSVSPSGYTRTNSFTFSWPVAGENAASDTGGSGLVGYQYKINTGAWSGTFSDGSVALSDIASTGVNIFYLRAVDTAGNYDLTPVQTNFYYNASAPTAPQNLAVTPATNSVNSFAFSWDLPLTYSGSIDGYYYSINALPTLANTTYTTSTSLAADAYATQQGINTFYIVAKDESGNYDFASCSSISGNPAVDSCAKVDFSADTSAPGIPTVVTVVDGSNRDLKLYKVFLSWEAPTNQGAGFSGYEIYRSTNGSSFSSIGTTTGTTYADTGLSSRIYYYYIKSKDNANQYSAASETVSITPTGKWTTPPNLVAQPKITVGSFTAAITWQTDREGSSFIEYGLSPDKIGTANGGETKGQLDDVMDHSVTLKGLQPNTTYYYQAVWVDTDGNRGASGTLTFTTKPAPQVSEVDGQSNITLNSILVNWSTTVTANCYINYGETTAYGGILRETAGAFASAHSMNLLALEHSTTYHFQISCYDTDSNIFSSDDYKEATLTMPQISEFRFETVADAPTTTLKFSWKTNVPTTSIISYTPSGAQAQTQSKADYETEHNLTASDLSDKTTYSLQAKGVDQHGNTAQSETATFTTPDDTRPPKISELTVEVKSSGFGTAQKSQVIVGWQTDEPGTSQVEYAQGISGQEYNFKTKEDSNLATSHVVIIPDLDPSKIYHLRAISRDKANNLGSSEDTTVITGKEQKGILDIIINSLSLSLGWLFNIFQR